MNRPESLLQNIFMAGVVAMFLSGPFIATGYHQEAGMLLVFGLVVVIIAIVTSKPPRIP